IHNNLHSRVKIKAFLKKQILEENKKKPLSDVILRDQLLAEYEIKLSVRVVAKYRNELKILDYLSRKSV
ncbi:RNA polymerase sigma-54 factor, partial [bacterium]|nr:RNA polymerase sigma-54 factor [bacterium]